MKTITYRYEEVPSYRDGIKKCCQCEARIKKRFKEYQTINPFNNKTRNEIYAANEEKLNRIVTEWESEVEKCAACIKLETPDIDINLLTADDWESTKKLRIEICEMEKSLLDKKRELEEQVKGRHIELTIKGKKRYGLVDYLYDYNKNKYSFGYTLLRFDLKGETTTTDQVMCDRLFNTKITETTGATA